MIQSKQASWVAKKIIAQRILDQKEWCGIGRITSDDWDHEMRIMMMQCGSKTGQ